MLDSQKTHIPKKNIPKTVQSKKNVMLSFLDGLIEKRGGESYGKIMRYFAPEFITTLVLYSLLYLLDAWWIADLKSTSAYATSGVTNTLFHLITKMAEGFSVGATVMVGNYNGLHEWKNVGRTVTDAFWMTCITGGVISLLLYSGAYWIYYLYGVPDKMIALGIPFLRLRALSIFFMFVYFAFVGFLRGIKNPKIPMIIYMLGGAVFLFFDYALIFGNFGFPAMKLQGSALASVIQYGVMLCAVLVYMFVWPDNRKYGISLFSTLPNLQSMKQLCTLSGPVILDKATLAFSYLWLGALLAPMGKYVIASYTVIKDLERLAILPAAAFAQVITFLVSNDYSVHNWSGIKANIKKVIVLASVFVFAILLVFSLWPDYFIHFFDLKGKFTGFAAKIFPVLSVLVFFDLLQLILSGALRGAANVRMVMGIRLATFFGYFIPVSWLLSRLPIENNATKFLLIYGAFYVGNGLMSIVYIRRFRGQRWKSKSI